MPDSQEYLKIQKKVRLKKGFFIHFGIYVIVILFLAIINFLTNDGYNEWWFLFPAVSWGAAVAIHWLAVFGFSSIGVFGDDWEKEQISTELKKRGMPIEPKQLSSTKEINIDEHLDLKEMKKKINYDEQDLV